MLGHCVHWGLGWAPVKSADALCQNELLATLATALDAISPGAGAKAAFESPRSPPTATCLHGCHATGQAPQAQPRALGEQLKATLEATPPTSAGWMRLKSQAPAS